jgi:hypothetical protein
MGLGDFQSGELTADCVTDEFGTVGVSDADGPVYQWDELMREIDQDCLGLVFVL